MKIEVIAQAGLLIEKNGQTVQIVKGDTFTLYGTVFNYKGMIIDIRDYQEVFEIQKMPGVPKLQTYEFTADAYVKNSEGEDVLFEKGTQFKACNDVVYVAGCVIDISKMSYCIKAVETVEPEPEPEPEKLPANIAFGAENYSVAVEGIETVTVTKDTTADVAFASSDNNIVTVDALGNITGVAIGEAVITATSEANDEYEAGTASVPVTVTANQVQEPVDNQEPVIP